MTDKCVPTDESNPTATKGLWEAPSVEELDFSSTQGAPNAPGAADGIYIS